MKSCFYALCMLCACALCAETLQTKLDKTQEVMNKLSEYSVADITFDGTTDALALVRHLICQGEDSGIDRLFATLVLDKSFLADCNQVLSWLDQDKQGAPLLEVLKQTCEKWQTKKELIAIVESDVTERYGLYTLGYDIQATLYALARNIIFNKTVMMSENKGWSYEKEVDEAKSLFNSLLPKVLIKLSHISWWNGQYEDRYIVVELYDAYAQCRISTHTEVTYGLEFYEEDTKKNRLARLLCLIRAYKRMGTHKDHLPENFEQMVLEKSGLLE